MVKSGAGRTRVAPEAAGEVARLGRGWPGQRWTRSVPRGPRFWGVSKAGQGAVFQKVSFARPRRPMAAGAG